MARKVVKRANDDVRNISVRGANCKKGQVAATAVQIDKSDDLSEIVVFFQYNQTVLTKPRVVLGTAVEKYGWTMATNLSSPGVIMVSLSGGGLGAGVGTLMELRFDLMPNVNIGDQGAIEITECKAKPSSISLQGSDGVMTVVG